MQDGRRMPLSLAAQKLGWPWARTRDAVLTGRLQGELRNGRWEVLASSVEAVREAAGAAADA
jgi:hypothetical protein